MRIYRNGSPVIVAGFIARNYAHKAYEAEGFEAARFLNVTETAHQSRELNLGLRPMMGSVHEGSIDILTSKIYPDGEVRPPMLVTLSTKLLTPFPVKILIFLGDTNMCELA